MRTFLLNQTDTALIVQHRQPLDLFSLNGCQVMSNYHQLMSHSNSILVVKHMIQEYVEVVDDDGRRVTLTLDVPIEHFLSTLTKNCLCTAENM